MDGQMCGGTNEWTCPAAEPTLVLLSGVVVVDLLSDALAFAQVPSQVLLLLLIVVAEEFLPVVGVHVLLLLDDLPLHLLLKPEHTHPLISHPGEPPVRSAF